MFYISTVSASPITIVGCVQRKQFTVSNVATVALAWVNFKSSTWANGDSPGNEKNILVGQSGSS